MAKKIIIISSFPVCIVLAALAIVFVGIGRGQPEIEVSIDSTKAQIISLIDAGKITEADAAFQKLVTNFAGNAHIAEAVHEIAGHCRWLKKYEKSRQLCRYVVDNWPGSESAMWSQMGVAVPNAALGETGAAQVAGDKLLAGFSSY